MVGGKLSTSTFGMYDSPMAFTNESGFAIGCNETFTGREMLCFLEQRRFGFGPPIRTKKQKTNHAVMTKGPCIPPVPLPTFALNPRPLDVDHDSTMFVLVDKLLWGE